MANKTVQLSSLPVISGTKIHNATATNQTWYLTMALVCTATSDAMAGGGFAYSTEGAFQGGFTFREGVPGANAGNMAGQYGAVPFAGAEVTASGFLPATPGSGTVLWEQTVQLTHHTGIYLTYHGNAAWGQITYDDANVGAATVKCCYILQVDDPTYTVADLVSGTFATHFLVSGETVAEGHIADTDAAHAASAISTVGGIGPGGFANLAEEITWLDDNKLNSPAALTDLSDVVNSWTLTNGDLLSYNAAGGSVFANLPASTFATSGHNHTGTYIPVASLLTAYKTADETVTTNASVQDDNELTFTVAANTTYALEGFLIVSGSSAGDIRFNWTKPTGTTVDYGLGWMRDNVTSTTYGDTDKQLFTEAADAAVALPSSAGVPIVITMTPHGTVVTSSTAGTLTLSWAQGTSNGTATTVFAGSWLKLTKLS